MFFCSFGQGVVKYRYMKRLKIYKFPLLISSIFSIPLSIYFSSGLYTFYEFLVSAIILCPLFIVLLYIFIDFFIDAKNKRPLNKKKVTLFFVDIFLILSIIAILNLVGGIYFFLALRKYVCPRCVNFSCPLNRVPKRIVDAYLENNPIMKNAWESKGYKLG